MRPVVGKSKCVPPQVALAGVVVVVGGSASAAGGIGAESTAMGCVLLLRRRGFRRVTVVGCAVAIAAAEHERRESSQRDMGTLRTMAEGGRRVPDVQVGEQGPARSGQPLGARERLVWMFEYGKQFVPREAEEQSERRTRLCNGAGGSWGVLARRDSLTSREQSLAPPPPLPLCPWAASGRTALG